MPKIGGLTLGKTGTTECPHCHRNIRIGSFKRHLDAHDVSTYHPCPHENCGKRFAQKSALKTHLNIHTGRKPYACKWEGCNSEFGDPASFSRHKRTVHGHGILCPFEDCGIYIKRSDSLKKHIKSQHKADPNNYEHVFAAARKPGRAYTRNTPLPLPLPRTDRAVRSTYSAQALSFAQNFPLVKIASEHDDLHLYAFPSHRSFSPPQSNALTTEQNPECLELQSRPPQSMLLGESIFSPPKSSPLMIMEGVPHAPMPMIAQDLLSPLHMSTNLDRLRVGPCASISPGSLSSISSPSPATPVDYTPSPHIELTGHELFFPTFGEGSLFGEPVSFSSRIDSYSNAMKPDPAPSFSGSVLPAFGTELLQLI
ncbi:hypothetical protein K488DRAFT_84597 [Vararia minispora EC-137]|uniref:Uncharacterized protein n=1 Tax=Vararia minispora EC-137 TaxID=1314806 RepID=A0ACB8QQP7_9AGAM|nr:hypothetical protein K488DRAFT_84597 [Vararia minispora EC-137]